LRPLHRVVDPPDSDDDGDVIASLRCIDDDVNDDDADDF
jgi:hypothetical protein